MSQPPPSTGSHSVLTHYLYFLFRELSVHVFCLYYNWNVGFVLYLLSSESSLYILDTSPLLDVFCKHVFPMYSMFFFYP